MFGLVSVLLLALNAGSAAVNLDESLESALNQLAEITRQQEDGSQRFLASVVQGRQSVIGFVDPAVCYPALSNADTDGDDMVSAEEYVSFVQDMGPDNFLSDVSTFDDLPTVLQSNFLALACLCQTDPDDDSCCIGGNAGLKADGSSSGEEPSAAEESYLFLVCSLTSNSIDRVLMSVPPTVAPTQEPTVALTTAPTSSPTVELTVAPTSSPTVDLTTAPTIALTDTPTISQTAAPTTISQTAAPTTLAPTREPGVPTVAPTLAPTATPTTAGPTTTPIPVQVPVDVTYEIGVRLGGESEVYLSELVGAMDSLAPAVLSDVLEDLRRRLLRGGRRLQSLTFPTTAGIVKEIECPSSPDIAADDVCEEVMASMILIFDPNDESREDTEDAFVLELDSQIAAGELASAMSLLWPDSLVYILDDSIVGVREVPDSEDSVSGGGVFGIVVGALAVVVVVGFLATRRQSPKEDTPETMEAVPPQKEIEPFEPKDAPVPVTTADYDGKDQDAMMDNDEAVANYSFDTSSNAGSSGWSSSAGVSSVNGEDENYNQSMTSTSFGSTLRALGMDPTTQTLMAARDVRKTPVVTRADLDSAIEQGDWAAVGATAALLAAASDSQSFSSQSAKLNTSENISASEGSSLDAARAAELDQLVESGDWEGVVLAAAKYEAGGDSVDESSHSASQSTTTQGTLVDVQEYRQQVEDLVRRVVPDELPNVDEMMQQFRGREEELIETLRTMEERAVAQKARDATQKQAKTQAKQKTPQQRAADASTLLSTLSSPDTDVSFQEATAPSLARSLGSGLIVSSTKSLGTGQIVDTALVDTAKSKSMGTGEIVEKKQRKHTSLEEAIEAGDWQAVGDAAAMLSDHSLASSVETDEILRLADGVSSQGSVSSRGNLSDRAEELEDLIEKGDWTGVVNAAAGMTSESSKRKTAEDEARRQRRLKQRKEEEDAIAEAGIWDAIAEQTKQEGGTASPDRGAREATDWAIGRSLDALGRAGEDDGLTREDSTPVKKGDLSGDDA